MTNQVNQVQTGEFRQTLNTYTKQWCVPKRKMGNKWGPINNLKCVVHKRDGISYALWRVRELVLRIRCTTHNQQAWKCDKITKTKRGVYSVYHFKCTRIKHSISGVM